MTAVPIAVSEDGGPPPIETTELELTAAELLARSDQAMREVEFFRMFIEDPGHGFGLAESAGPGLIETITFVDIFEPGGVPEYREYDDGRPNPDANIFNRTEGNPLDPDDPREIDTSAQDVRIIGTDRVGGRAAWVVWYWRTAASVEGPFTRWITEWIDQETLWLLRQEATNNDPFGYPYEPVRTFFDFEDPGAPRRYPSPVAEAELQRFTDILVVRPVEDVYIDERRPNKNYEGDAILEAEGAPWRRSLLRFEIEDLPQGSRIISASLGLFVTQASFEREGARQQRLGTVHGVEGEWRAPEVTWTTAPRVGESLGELGSPLGYPNPTGLDYTNTWVQADVSEAVTSAGIYDFYLLNEGDLSGAEFAALENTEDAPVLTITYEYPVPLLVPTTAVPGGD